MNKIIATFALVVVALATTLVSPVSAGDGWSKGEGPWMCSPRDSAPMHGHDDGHDYPEPKGKLSKEDCDALKRELRQARFAATRYPTAQDAIDAGYRMIVPYVSGMGAHYVGPWGLTQFDPAKPNFLLYGGNASDAPLVGLMYTGVGPEPPEGFTGDNDHWHRHDPLCMVAGLIIAEGISNADCRARGGFNIDVSLLWMAHVWIVPGEWTYTPDVFRAHHPDLGPVPPA